MRDQDFPDTLNGDRNRRPHQGKPYSQRGNGLGFSVSVRMIVIAGFDGILQPEIHDQGTEDVRQRFHCVRHERIRMAQDSSRQFGRSQKRIDRQPQKRRAQTSLESFLLHVGLLAIQQGAGKL